MKFFNCLSWLFKKEHVSTYTALPIDEKKVPILVIPHDEMRDVRACGRVLEVYCNEVYSFVTNTNAITDPDVASKYSKLVSTTLEVKTAHDSLVPFPARRGSGFLPIYEVDVSMIRYCSSLVDDYNKVDAAKKAEINKRLHWIIAFLITVNKDCVKAIEYDPSADKLNESKWSFWLEFIEVVGIGTVLVVCGESGIHGIFPIPVGVSYTLVTIGVIFILSTIPKWVMYRLKVKRQCQSRTTKVLVESV